MTDQTGPTAVAVTGAADIRSITNTGQQLLQTLQQCDHLVLQFDHTAEHDLTFVQLIEATRRYARTEHKQVSLAEPASALMRETLTRGGFLVRPDDRVFWLQETGD